MLRTTRDARGIVTLSLDRPEAKNALSAALVGEITAALGTLAEDPAVRVIILTATGSVFCAGADIGEMRAAGAASTAQNEADSLRFAKMLESLERQPQPTIALVNGAAYGGALGLIAACDIALCTSSARFALSEVRLGLVPAMISPYVIRAIGQREARRWFLTGETMDAVAAMRIGLVHEALDESSLRDASDGIVNALLAGGPSAQAEIKRLLHRVTGRSSAVDESMITDTTRWIARVRAGAEAREGLTAFLERRKPGWIRDP